MKQPSIYILANKKNGTLYTGVTSDLELRIKQHKQKIFGGFSSKYGCTMLVFYQTFETMDQAIIHEKKLKKSSRARKIRLIEMRNPEWNNLAL